MHPQQWSDDIDYAGKRVVVIGSGATAVTLVPAMAERAKHVTMLQRSPSYVVSLPGEDPLARLLGRVLPARLTYSIVRWKNVLLTMLSFELSRRRPRIMKALIRKGLERKLPPGYDIDTHFTPRYNPWDQRLCLVPDGDLFEALRRAAPRWSPTGSRPSPRRACGWSRARELEADLIVTATGLNLLPLGGMEIGVDGREVELPETMGYKGMMLSEVPNLAVAIGYTNASWTLKCDLTCEYVCRLLNHMDEHGYRQCTPRQRDPSVKSGAVHRLQLRLRGARHRPVPAAGVQVALAPVPELPARHPGPAPRRDRGRGAGVLARRGHGRGGRAGRGLSTSSSSHRS